VKARRVFVFIFGLDGLLGGAIAFALLVHVANCSGDGVWKEFGDAADSDASRPGGEIAIVDGMDPCGLESSLEWAEAAGMKVLEQFRVIAGGWAADGCSIGHWG
jgi:hypothetical protein